MHLILYHDKNFGSFFVNEMFLPGLFFMYFLGKQWSKRDSNEVKFGPSCVLSKIKDLFINQNAQWLF